MRSDDDLDRGIGDGLNYQCREPQHLRSLVNGHLLFRRDRGRTTRDSDFESLLAEQLEDAERHRGNVGDQQHTETEDQQEGYDMPIEF